MIELSHIALTRWGKWSRVLPVVESANMAFNYQKKTINDDDPDYDDPIADIVDRSVASMPREMTQIDFVLKLKYIFERTNYEAAQKVHTSEAQYKILLGRGQIWVGSYLTAIHQHAGCPPELKEFFDGVEELRIAMEKQDQEKRKQKEQEALPNGPIQRRSGPVYEALKRPLIIMEKTKKS